MDLSHFKIIGEAEHVAELKEQKARLIKLRWFYIGLLAAVAVVSSLLVGQPWRISRNYLTIALAGLLLNGLFYLAHKLPTKLRATIALLIMQLILDVGIAAAVIYNQGGLEARTTVLFAIPIVSAGLLFTADIVYLTAALASLSYIGSALFYSSQHHLAISLSASLVPLVFYPTVFIILARLVVYLMMVNNNDTRERAYDAFLALLMHQLKRPASTANAIIDQLEQSKPLTAEKQRKYVSMLKAENQQLLTLLDNLFETAASTSQTALEGESDLPALLQRISYSCAETYQRGADLKLKLEDLSFTVAGNAAKLSTALVNIINNAFEYSQPGTPVRINAHNAGADAVIIVEDKGSGISRDVKRRLFSKYNVRMSGDKGVNGLGLGLFVARKIILAQGGSLHVVSDASGTKVIITLRRGKQDGQKSTTD